jgi:hypothetical protein
MKSGSARLPEIQAISFSFPLKNEPPSKSISDVITPLPGPNELPLIFAKVLVGTRITALILSASAALRELDQNSEISRRHLGKLNHSARDLVVAMDDLVWAVDPAHDSLDQLATHLTRLAEKIIRDSPIRCRLDIPSLLPPLVLGSDFRHQLSLAVKEALHNIYSKLQIRTRTEAVVKYLGH